MSKVEVNTIEPQCGTTLTVGKCTTSVAVPGNVVKSNALQASDGGNIVSQSGTDITLGASGDTINLASGASQSGFGRTGTVDWVTTPKVTGDSPVTAATGSGYFLNTTAGTITINLPAGAAGSIVSMADYAATWQTYNVTVNANGSEKIGGVADAATLSTEGQSVTLVYVDSTQGWVNTMDSTSNVRAVLPFIQACGGNATVTCGDYKTHIFTAPGTFCVSALAPGPSGNPNQMDYLVVAGGGAGGGNSAGGGGGAGGFRMSNEHAIPAPTTSPLANPTGLTASVSPYPIAVGAAGAGASLSSGANPGTSGANSIFDSITSTGGGFGSGSNLGTTGTAAADGGSGGGGSHEGNTASGSASPVTSPAQGNPGGTPVGPTARGAGGGGAGAAGATSPGNPTGGAGGIGSYIGDGMVGPTAPSYGTPGPASNTRYFAGGAGGSGDSCQGAGGSGGGGAGSNEPANPAQQAKNGIINTGGGGGGSRGNLPTPYTENAPNGTNGGSGIVMIRYKFQ